MAVSDTELLRLSRILALKHRGLLEPFGPDFEDYSQEVSLALLRARKRFDPERSSSFSHYADIRAKGVAADYLRTAKLNGRRWTRSTGKTTLEVDLLDLEVKYRGVHFDDLSIVYAKELLADLRHPYDYIVLCRASGLTSREIAGLLGIGEASVSKKILELRDDYYLRSRLGNVS